MAIYTFRITDKPRTKTNPPVPEDDCVVVEAALPQKKFVADTTLHPTLRNVREFVLTRLLKGNSLSSRGNVMKNPVFVRATGQLFYDTSHLKVDGSKEERGKKNLKSKTLWELHPVTDLRFAPKPAGPQD